MCCSVRADCRGGIPTRYNNAGGTEISPRVCACSAAAASFARANFTIAIQYNGLYREFLNYGMRQLLRLSVRRGQRAPEQKVLNDGELEQDLQAASCHVTCAGRKAKLCARGQNTQPAAVNVTSASNILIMPPFSFAQVATC